MCHQARTFLDRCKFLSTVGVRNAKVLLGTDVGAESCSKTGLGASVPPVTRKGPRGQRSSTRQGRRELSSPDFDLEATPRIELGMEVLQTSALPLGYVATRVPARF